MKLIIIFFAALAAARAQLFGYPRFDDDDFPRQIGLLQNNLWDGTGFLRSSRVSCVSQGICCTRSGAQIVCFPISQIMEPRYPIEIGLPHPHILLPPVFENGGEVDPEIEKEAEEGEAGAEEEEEDDDDGVEDLGTSPDESPITVAGSPTDTTPKFVTPPETVDVADPITENLDEEKKAVGVTDFVTSPVEEEPVDAPADEVAEAEEPVEDAPEKEVASPTSGDVLTEADVASEAKAEEPVENTPESEASPAAAEVPTEAPK